MIGKLLFNLYRVKNWRIRSLVRNLVCRIEGGAMFSVTIRRIFREYHGIDVGMYTHGGCFELSMVDPNTRIGRYCSIAKGVRIVNHIHPLEFKSTSPLFFNPAFGYCKDWLVDFKTLEIGNDVWIGANAIILQDVSRIGDGAVIGAGAVVNHDVPPYAIVVGNPARLVRYRFPEAQIRRLLAEGWWKNDLDAIAHDLRSFQTPLESLGKSDALDPKGFNPEIAGLESPRSK